MSLRFTSERLADLRRDAQLLIERAGQFETFVAIAEQDRRHAQAAASHAADDRTYAAYT